MRRDRQSDRRWRRILAAKLAAQISTDETPADMLFSRCIFFECWIERGGDETQKRMKLLDERSAELHVLQGGKS